MDVSEQLDLSPIMEKYDSEKGGKPPYHPRMMLSKQITRAFWLCCGRAPDAFESRDSLDFITKQGIAAFCRAMLNSNEFVFIQ